MRNPKHQPFLLVLTAIILLPDPATAQYLEGGMDFDQLTYIGLPHIDTADGHGGVWQIGAPQKQVFTTAYSVPNVIVTDTLHTYPPNDTSRFTIVGLAGQGWNWPHTVALSGYYQADTDSLNDFATIEVSYNPDSAWIDLIRDTVLAPLIYWSDGAPSFTGTTNGWQYFNANLSEMMSHLFPSGHQVEVGDTIRWRFTFISDSLDNDRDGIMFDDLYFEDWAEGIPEYSAITFHSTVAPMPVADELNLIYETAGLDKIDLTIRDARGTVVRHEHMRAEHKSRIDIHDLAAGPYMYSIQANNGRDRSAGRFVKE